LQWRAFEDIVGTGGYGQNEIALDPKCDAFSSATFVHADCNAAFVIDLNVLE
jgi:hypothetical protein